MPIYEYRCSSCSHEFELTRPISEATAPAKCPVCGGDAAKLPSLFGSTFGYGIKVPERKPFRQAAPAGQEPAKAPADSP